MPTVGKRRVYFARHGERLDFVDDEYRRTSGMPDDPPLSARGEAQARALGERLKHCGITAVISSPFRRCVRTACIAAAALPAAPRVCVDAASCERLSVARYWKTETGPLWAGLDELAEETGVVDGVPMIDSSYRPLFALDYNVTAFPESSTRFEIRCKAVVEQIINRSLAHANILIVGHVSSIKGLVHALVPKTSFWRPVTCT